MVGLQCGSEGVPEEGVGVFDCLMVLIQGSGIGDGMRSEVVAFIARELVLSIVTSFIRYLFWLQSVPSDHLYLCIQVGMVKQKNLFHRFFMARGL
jgi:hypothetical protein